MKILSVNDLKWVKTSYLHTNLINFQCYFIYLFKSFQTIKRNEFKKYISFKYDIKNKMEINNLLHDIFEKSKYFHFIIYFFSLHLLFSY
jgi:hypothetical protein